MRAFILCLVAFGFAACGSDTSADEQKDYTRFNGETMGTTYSVIHTQVTRNTKTAIDSLLADVNMGVSTYIPSSVISQFNSNGHVKTADEHFITNTIVSADVYELSGGAFDPTVGPLVNAWGFGWEGRRPVTPVSETIDSLLELVGFDKLIIAGTDSISVSAPQGMKLDYSAIAKGYGVDAVGRYLESLGVNDYFVEIGGEVRVRGNSPRSTPWIVGINQPSEQAATNEIFARVSLNDMSMATSGNYRNFYEVDGKKVWHTINPVSGFPEENPVLSASVVHPDCIMADALATACMVIGPESLDMISKTASAELYLIVRKDNGELEALYTDGFEQYLKDE